MSLATTPSSPSLTSDLSTFQARSKGAAPSVPTPTTPGEPPGSPPGGGAGAAGGGRRREFV